MIASPPDVLAINGGDGTVHVVLTALLNRLPLEQLPLVQVLPGGTMNTSSGSYGVRGRMLGVIGHSPETWLRALLAYERVGDVPVVLRSVIRVESPGFQVDGRDVPAQFGFLFGNGLISNFLEAYYEGSEPTPAKALWILGRGILSSFIQGAAIRRLMKPASVRVIAPDGQGADQTWPPTAYLAVGAGTVDDIGFGFRAFFPCLDHPGRMHVLGVACSAFTFVTELPRIFLARAPRSPEILQHTLRSFRMTSEADMVYMIDGDFHRAGRELRVSATAPIRLGRPELRR